MGHFNEPQQKYTQLPGLVFKVCRHCEDFKAKSLLMQNIGVVLKGLKRIIKPMLIILSGGASN